MWQVTRRWGRRRKKLLDELKDRRGYSHLKEEALDRTMWRNRFRGDFGPVVRQNTEWMSVWMPQTAPFTVAFGNIFVFWIWTFIRINRLILCHNFLALMKNALRSFETRRTIYPCTRRNVPEGSKRHETPVWNLKPGNCLMQCWLPK